MNDFYGRERELKKLEGLYKSQQFQFCVFYGRRRVGKTTLINQFIENKDAIYYMAMEGTKQENLYGLSNSVLSAFDNNTSVNANFSDYEAMFQFIDRLAMSSKRYVIAIDEYPYLAMSYPAISSLLQRHIDQCWKDSKLFLILCGSSMSFMEEQVLGYKSPLYGRRTAQFKVQPFTFFEIVNRYTMYTLEERALLYGITGGIPEYLSRISVDRSIDENVVDLFFNESGRLYEEPSNLLKQELREPSSYHSIISAIASGASRMNEIATKTGLESSGCSSQINTLISLGIVKKEYPVTETETTRKTIYRLHDTMFLFWYRFVRPNMSSIMRGLGEHIYYGQVKVGLSDFMGFVFEEICKQYLYQPNIFENLPFIPGNMGRWWGNNKVEKRQEEIDIMAVEGKNALFGECKWKNTPLGMEVLETLLRRANLFSYEKNYYFIFSKNGFQEELLKKVEAMEQVKVLSLEDMVI